ncbi:MAG: HEAT repeat domain-containing protein [Deltaproteobacteria bacterium]|nr:HEAT repeat domain-containing protein [Deltaproteobacteria bacterium]
MISPAFEPQIKEENGLYIIKLASKQPPTSMKIAKPNINACNTFITYAVVGAIGVVAGAVITLTDAEMRTNQNTSSNITVISSKRVKNDITNIHKWPTHCQDEFDYLAQNHPGILVALIKNNEIEDTLLTFAAESLGLSKNTELVETTLLPLLKHQFAPVREGAIYGLQRHIFDSSKIHEAIQDVSLNDTSKGVRSAAHDAISMLESA